MARGLSYNLGSAARRAASYSQRGGFTLIEVLVVLGILVVLFALLFVPMMQGVGIATSGRVQAEMQQSLRMAMEQVNRDLTEAMYVYPPELIRVAAASSAYTGEHAYLVNYSTMSLVLPAKDAAGQVKQPLQPEFASTPAGSRLPLVTRYAVHTTETVLRKWPASASGFPATDKYFMVSAGPGPESTFQLYRQQGFCVYDADLGTYTFGSFDPATGNFVIDRPNAENALTPRMGADVVCTRTVCRDNGKSVDGYVPVNLNTVGDATDDTLDNPPDSTWTPHVVYQFDGIQFRPERIADDQMQISADGATYRAQKGSWLGQLNDGKRSIYDLVWGSGLWINSSELRPRIVVRRWNAADGAYSTTVMDTDLLDPAQPAPGPDTDNLLTLRYNSQAGTVSVADSMPVAGQEEAAPGVLFADQNDPGLGFWTLDSARVDVLPEWPGLPTSRSDPRAPVGYVLDPWRAEGVVGAWNPWSIQGQATNRDVQIVPGTIRVWLVWKIKNTNEVQRRELALTTVQDQDQIGVLQFTTNPFDNGRQVELKFNPSLPPGPDLVAYIVNPNLTGSLEFTCRIEIAYQARRNFDPGSGRDDQITASYSTGSAYNVRLALSEYSPYETPSGGAVFQTPFKPGAQAVLSARMAVGNLGR